MRTIVDIILEELEKSINGEEMDMDRLSGDFLLNKPRTATPEKDRPRPSGGTYRERDAAAPPEDNNANNK